MSKQPKSNSIRIIAGKWRGRRLPVPTARGLRPTTDRVRETVFNWLMHDLAGARCLDLFAGSGALGLESLSRGAADVQFVESNPEAARSLQNCLKLLQSPVTQSGVAQTDATHSANPVLEMDALVFLGRPATRQFDIVFLDPPFGSDSLETAAALLERNDWLATAASIYIEHNSAAAAPKLPSRWLQYRSGRAGQSGYYLYRRE